MENGERWMPVACHFHKRAAAVSQTVELASLAATPTVLYQCDIKPRKKNYFYCDTLSCHPILVNVFEALNLL